MNHEEPLFQACFSPDGQRILTTSWDRTARIWDTTTGLGLARFYHPAGLDDAAFSPDGRRFATACFDGTARVWDADCCDKPLMTLPTGTPLQGVAFSPDGKRLAVASWNGTLHLWNLIEAGSLVQTIQQPGVSFAHFNGDGTRILAVGSGERTIARAWDAATGDALGPVLPHEGPVRSANFSQDGQSVLTAGDDGKVRLREAGSGRDLIPPLVHPQSVTEALFSQDERFLLTACQDKSVRVWEPKTGKPKFMFPHPDAITSLALSPAGDLVATGCKDGIVRLLDPVGGGARYQPMTNSAAVLRVRFSGDGTRLVVAYESPGRSGGNAQLWDIRSGKVLGAPMRHNDDVVDAEFDREGQAVVTASVDRSARIWNASTGLPLTPLLWHRGALLQAVFSPDGHRVATLTEDGEVRLWDASTGEPITPPLSHPSQSDHGSLAFSPDGNRLLIATGAGSVFVREFRPSQASPEELVSQAQVLSGHRIEAGEGVIPLGNTLLSNTWRTLHPAGKVPAKR